MSDERYLEIAHQLAKRSTCQKVHYGSLLVKDSMIIGRGYNKPIHVVEPFGRKCCLRKSTVSGHFLEKCLALHAEEKALYDCLTMGFDPRGSTLYLAKETKDSEPLYFTDLICCSWCSRNLMYNKVSDVVIEISEDQIQHVSIVEVFKIAYEN